MKPPKTKSSPPDSGTVEVLVLGVMASGKTTFLSVLGHEFEKTGAFGLGLTAAYGTNTREFVEEMWHRMTRNNLDERGFPPATAEEDATLLSWDVEIGANRLFRLSTLDCAGETVRRVFSFADGARRASSRKADSWNNNPFDDAESGKTERNPETRLRRLAEKASVLCLFIRPRDLVAGFDGDASDVARKRTRDIVDTVLAVAKGPMGEGRDLLFVLTDAERRTDAGRQSEWAAKFQKAGGPKKWLFSIIPELERSDRALAANAIVVSAVPQTFRRAVQSGESVIPATNFSPEGLEAFLLSVGGLVHPMLEPLGAGLREMGDARSAYFDTVACGDATYPGKRHELAESWSDSAQKWEKAARRRLSDNRALSASQKEDTERFIAESILEANRRFALETALKRELTAAGKNTGRNWECQAEFCRELSRSVVRAANAALDGFPEAEPFALPDVPTDNPACDPRLPAPTDPWWKCAIDFYRPGAEARRKADARRMAKAEARERRRVETEARRKAKAEAREMRRAEAAARRKAKAEERRKAIASAMKEFGKELRKNKWRLFVVAAIACACFLVWKGCIETKPVPGECPNCKGEGKVVVKSGWWIFKKEYEMTCPTCHGKGEVDYNETWWERNF